MERKTREEKAITLIALIITIVVLLILAVVAINAVTGDGIIQHATNAKTEYENAQAKEEGLLSYYQEYLDAKGDLGPWKQDGNKIYMENSEGEKFELEIGAIVNYDATAGTDNSLLTYTSQETVTGVKDQTYTANKGKWKVLGIENGKILLVSADDIKTDEGNYYSIMYSRLYLIGIQEFNNICAIYGHGIGAQNARSINVDDVNKITKFDPDVYGSGLDTLNEYGNTIVYTAREGRTTFKPANGEEGTVVGINGNIITNGTFHYIENNEWKHTLLPVGETRTFEVDAYVYAASQDSSSASTRNINMNMSSNSEEYTMIFKNLSDSTEARYYLASKMILAKSDENFTMFYGVRGIDKGGIGGAYTGGNNDAILTNADGRGMRPVVILEKNVELEKQSDGSFNIVI